jgi:hypothetical protein
MKEHILLGAELHFRHNPFLVLWHAIRLIQLLIVLPGRRWAE